MAIFHFDVKVIRRSDGRTATAAAAYCAGQCIRDHRTGETFDYGRKPVAASGLLGWDGDRETLWNTAEAAERKRNSVVARTVVVALPHELPPSARQALVEDLAAFLRQRHGIAVDWSIHPPSPDGDQRQHHAHLILTTRRVEAEAFGPKTRELDRKPDSRDHIRAWRKQWARLCNEAFRAHGIAAAIDHRSHAAKAKALGVPALRPMRHLGPAATHLMRRGLATFIEADNAARALANGPVLALRAEARRAVGELAAIATDDRLPAERARERGCPELE